MKHNLATHKQTGRGDWALGSSEQNPTPDRAVRPGMPGLALPETRARPGIGTGEGFGVFQTRTGGAGGCGIVRYTYALLRRTLVHVI